MPISRCFTKRGIRLGAAAAGVSSRWHTPARYFWRSSLPAWVTTLSSWESCLNTTWFLIEQFYYRHIVRGPSTTWVSTILFVGFVVCLKDTRVPKSVVFREWKEVDVAPSGRPQMFLYQDRPVEWCKVVKQGSEMFVMDWIAAERDRAVLWHAIVSTVTGRSK